MDCSPQSSSIHGIFQARILEWVAISFSRGYSWPNVWTQVSHNAGRLFTIWATVEVDIFYINIYIIIYTYSCCSVSKLCLTLCDPTNCSMPGLPVLLCLPEFAQTHVHWVSEAIQPSHPLLPTSPFALSFPHIRSFPMSQLFALGVWSIGASASAPVLPMNFQD